MLYAYLHITSKTVFCMLTKNNFWDLNRKNSIQFTYNPVYSPIKYIIIMVTLISLMQLFMGYKREKSVPQEW